MNVYEVKFESRVQSKKKHVKKWGKRMWVTQDDALLVLANGDATKAIEKARKHVLRQSPVEFDEEDGIHIERIVGFRVVGLDLIGSIDVH